MKAVDVLKNSFYGKNKVGVRGGAGRGACTPVQFGQLYWQSHAKIVSCLLIRATQMKQEEG